VIAFKLPLSGRWWGVAHIYPGRCHWAELNCPFRAIRYQREPFELSSSKIENR